MPCKQENVFYLVEDELTPAEAALVRGHIESCIACRSLHRRLVPAVEELRAATAPPVPSDAAAALREQFLARVREYREGALRASLPAAITPAEPPAGGLKPLSRWVLATAMAGLLVTGFVAGSLLHRADPGAPPPAAQPTTGPAPRPAIAAGAGTAAHPSPASPASFAAWGAETDPENPARKRYLLDRVTTAGTRILWTFTRSELRPTRQE